MAVWGQQFVAPPQFAFVQRQELLVRPNGNAPVDWFNHVLEESFFERLRAATNTYGDWFYGANYDAGHMIQWRHVSADEFRRFTGLFLLMGVNHVPEYAQYWANNDIFSFPVFRRTMSRDRFQQILSTIQFGYPSSAVDRLHKVRFVLDYIP